MAVKAQAETLLAHLQLQVLGFEAGNMIVILVVTDTAHYASGNLAVYQAQQ